MPKKVWTNADLREWFDKYNAWYFRGRLEVVRIEFAHLPDAMGRTVRMRDGRRRSKRDTWAILISREYRSNRRVCYSTILHEMVHVEQGCKYSCAPRGVHFNRRMMRLAKAGAFDGVW